jgi:alpha-L-rhamnosidase
MNATDSATTGLHAVDLRIADLVEPLGVAHDTAPRLTWRTASDLPGDRVVAAEIRVAGGTAAWSSGRLADPRGACRLDIALEPATRYDVVLELTGADGRRHVAETWFETTPLAGDPPGHWIARDPTAQVAEVDPPTAADRPRTVRLIDPVALLRRSFVLPARPTRARLLATARGVYRAHLNGERVGDAELAPGWTDYRARTLHQIWDVTDALRPGVNALGAELADGWWSGYVGFDARHPGEHYGPAPWLWMALFLEFADGSQTVVTTDAAWRQSRGEIEYSDPLMGEMIDARRSPGAWTTAEFDDAAWSPVLVGEPLSGPVSAESEAPIRVVERRTAVRRIGGESGPWIYDFGQNLVGRVELAGIDEPAGTEIVLRHGETLDGSSLYTANLRSAEARDVFIAHGEGPRTFTPAFAMHGFRFVEIAGPTRAPDLEQVTALVIGNDLPRTGTLETSHPGVNALIRNIDWSLRGNFVAVPTDCPQRDERLGWLADAQVFLPTALALRDVAPFLRRWLWDVRNAQSPEGSFPDIAPLVSRFFADGAPGWGDGGVVIPWELYRTGGDVAFLEDAYESVVAWVDFVAAANPDGVWRRRTGNAYGDWLSVGADTPREVLATAYAARSASIAAEMARILGRDEHDRLRERADLVRDAFVTAFVADDGLVTGGTQTGQTLALAFGLLPPQLRAPAAARLAELVEANGRRLSTGFLGVAELCPVLSDTGRSDLAFALLEQTAFPSWLYSVDRGATTIWERWDGWTDEAGFQAAEMNSFNHYSLGSIGAWLFGHLAGIRQEEGSVGYDDLVIAPEFGGSITSAAATLETVRGTVRVDWRVDGDRFELAVDIPPGRPARVVLPIANASGEAAEHLLPSGHHRLSARLQPAG